MQDDEMAESLQLIADALQTTDDVLTIKVYKHRVVTRLEVVKPHNGSLRRYPYEFKSEVDPSRDRNDLSGDPTKWLPAAVVPVLSQCLEKLTLAIQPPTIAEEDKPEVEAAIAEAAEKYVPSQETEEQQLNRVQQRPAHQEGQNISNPERYPG